MQSIWFGLARFFGVFSDILSSFDCFIKVGGRESSFQKLQCRVLSVDICSKSISGNWHAGVCATGIYEFISNVMFLKVCLSVILLSVDVELNLGL